MSVRDLVAPVPQPYKTWVARAIFVPAMPLLVAFAAVVEGLSWCKDMAGEIVDAWCDVRSW